MERTLSNLTVEKIRQLKVKLRRFETQPTLETELDPVAKTTIPPSPTGKPSPWPAEAEEELEEELLQLLRPGLSEDEAHQNQLALTVFEPFFFFFFHSWRKSFVELWRSLLLSENFT